MYQNCFCGGFNKLKELSWLVQSNACPKYKDGRGGRSEGGDDQGEDEDDYDDDDDNNSPSDNSKSDENDDDYQD